VESRIIGQGVITPDKIIIGTRFRTNHEIDEEFLESIREKGILQPVTIDQNWNLVAGGRRTQAAISLGISIPYIQRQTDGELDLRECELIENAFRKDFNWIDRNRLVNHIHSLMQEKHGGNWGQRKTADLLNKSVGGINRHLALNKAIGHFPDLAKCKTEDEAVKLFRRLSERVVVKDLVKQSAARAAQSETAVETDDSPSGEPSIPLGIQLALRAINHYRIGDALEEIEAIAAEGRVVNATFVEVDPPYGIDLTQQKKGEVHTLGEYNEVDQNAYPDFLRRLLSGIHKITPPDMRMVFWFGVEWYEQLREILTEVGFKYDFIPGLWVKPTGQTAAPDLYLARSYETFLVCWKGNGIPIRKRGRSNVFAFNPDPHTAKWHPTQRPIALIEELLSTFAWPGSLVMVPFLGSGTTVRVAYRLGMQSFGWDLSEQYKEGFLAAVEQDIQNGELDHVKGLD
jgi:ParB-like chromosome segregation protein Spo0J/DNA modification methylase